MKVYPNFAYVRSGALSASLKLKDVTSGSTGREAYAFELMPNGASVLSDCKKSLISYSVLADRITSYSYSSVPMGCALLPKLSRKISLAEAVFA